MIPIGYNLPGFTVSPPFQSNAERVNAHVRQVHGQFIGLDGRSPLTYTNYINKTARRMTDWIKTPLIIMPRVIDRPTSQRLISFGIRVHTFIIRS